MKENERIQSMGSTIRNTSIKLKVQYDIRSWVIIVFLKDRVLGSSTDKGDDGQTPAVTGEGLDGPPQDI